MARPIAKAKRPAKKKAPARPWLRLPARPDPIEDQTVRIYLKDRVLELDTGQLVDLQLTTSMDTAAQIQVDVFDNVGDTATFALLDQNEDLLLDGIDVRWGRVWWRLARVERTDTGWAMYCEDRVAAYLRSHTRPQKASRADITRAGFVHQLTRGVKAGGGITTYIPEVGDKQQIARAEVPKETAEKRSTFATARKSASTNPWGGDGAKVCVKRQRASAMQLRVINEALAEAQRLGASRRVMIAVNMCLTQESVAGKDTRKTGNDDIGYFQQGRNWISSANARDVARATRAFLLGHEAKVGGTDKVSGWKQRHGSLRNATGDLNAMIKAVQISVGGYADWQDESTKNVDVWLARNGTGSADDDPARRGASSKPTYYRAAYAFRTQGETGSEGRTDWWDATGKLAEEVAWHRWAAGNVLAFVSDDELIRGTPVLTVDRELQEIHQVGWSWDYRREASEMTVRVALEDTWSLLPGMVASVNDEEPVRGLWLIDTVRVSPILGANIAEVTLRRRGARKLEPAPEIRQREVKESKTTIGGKSSYGGSTNERSTGSAAAYARAIEISQENRPYVWGGGHARAGTPDGGTGRDPGTGYDCSGYVGACCAAGGMGIKPGQSIPDSGWFARSWGVPGRGKRMTVWANSGHVFIEFHGLGQYSNADTSAAYKRGNRNSGPHVRQGGRSTSGFTPRHWPGT